MDRLELVIVKYKLKAVVVAHAKIPSFLHTLCTAVNFIMLAELNSPKDTPFMGSK